MRDRQAFLKEIQIIKIAKPLTKKFLLN